MIASKNSSGILQLPAMAAGVTDRLWDMEDVVRLVEEREAAEIEGKPEKKAKRSDALQSPALGHDKNSRA